MSKRPEESPYHTVSGALYADTLGLSQETMPEIMPVTALWHPGGVMIVCHGPMHVTGDRRRRQEAAPAVAIVAVRGIDGFDEACAAAAQETMALACLTMNRPSRREELY